MSNTIKFKGSRNRHINRKIEQPLEEPVIKREIIMCNGNHEPKNDAFPEGQGKKYELEEFKGVSIGGALSDLCEKINNERDQRDTIPDLNPFPCRVAPSNNGTTT